MATQAMGLQHAAASDTLFARIGAFLALHRLHPTPEHYAFAYEVIANAGGTLARQVAGLTDGGYRLSARDIANLGGASDTDRPTPGDAEPDEAAPDESEAELLVARALTQLHGVTDTIRAAHAEAGDFGRDLRASADAIAAGNSQGAGVEEIARLTAAMIDRVQHAEQRLDVAQREADGLREELDTARGTALTDPLTGLPNRRAFDTALSEVDPEEPRVVALCDIDHFKAVNDDFGHLVGDRILKVVAQTLAEELDATVARWGGEEFAVLFAHADPEAAVERIDRARIALAERRLRVRETGKLIGSVTFSAGVSMAYDGAIDGNRALDRADRALYRAKDLGRARTVRAD